MKVVTVVGARPQFIKAAAISREIGRVAEKRNICERIIHTGQHFDKNMSGVFFEELQIPKPDYNLGIASLSHGAMTGRMLEKIEIVLEKEKPDEVIVYGDTNSTLAGALAAAKLNIPVAHIEAGLRSFNLKMPEEINRILTDRISSKLFCPTETAVCNLGNEGRHSGVYNVGDVMFDVSLFYRRSAIEKSSILSRLGLVKGEYSLATFHRAENIDDESKLEEIARALGGLSEKTSIVLPLHPRTRNRLQRSKLIQLLKKTLVVEPLSFLDMVALEQSATVILTDSGGVQKEAFFFGVPCLTVRGETEWVETVDLGLNQLVDAKEDAILSAFIKARLWKSTSEIGKPYGSGNAAAQIVDIICNL